jgi:YD repeat-containing protein
MRRVHHLLLAGLVIPLAQAAEAGETIAYSYDSLGRLVRVEHQGTVNSGISASYSYDPADNRTNVTVEGVPAVIGGGFEAPETGTGYVYRPAGGPVAYAGNSGVASNGSAWGFAAPEGDQVGFLQGGPDPATMSLPVTGLTVGASYRISFRISARPGYSGLPATLSFDGAALGTFSPPTAAFTSATGAAFTAAAGSGTLVFSASGTPYQASGIDLVTVAAASD